MELETTFGPKDVTLKHLGGATATGLLGKLLANFGEPIGKYLQTHSLNVDVSKLDLSELPLSVLESPALEPCLKELVKPCLIDGKQFDADVMFAGCVDSLLQLAFECVKLNYASAFKRLVSKFKLPTP